MRPTQLRMLQSGWGVLLSGCAGGDRRSLYRTHPTTLTCIPTTAAQTWSDELFFRRLMPPDAARLFAVLRNQLARNILMVDADSFD